MSKAKRLKMALYAVLIILAGIYLTFLVDTYTLNTWLKRIFVFCYFLVACSFAVFGYSKIKNHNLTVIPLLCAAVALVLCQNIFLPTGGEHTVTLRAEQTGEDTPYYGQVWLVDAESDGKSIHLANLELENSLGWSYSGEYDDFYFAPSENAEANKSNTLSFNVVGKETKLYLAANTWSGSVRISDSEKEGEVVSLYSDDEDVDVFVYTLKATRTYSVFERILYNAGALVVIFFAFKLVFALAVKLINKKKSDA